MMQYLMELSEGFNTRLDKTERALDKAMDTLEALVHRIEELNDTVDRELTAYHVSLFPHE
jgi:hypothetical protein